MVGTRGAAAQPAAELRWLLTTRGAAGLVWRPKWSSMMMRDAAALLAAVTK